MAKICYGSRNQLPHEQQAKKAETHADTKEPLGKYIRAYIPTYRPTDRQTDRQIYTHTQAYIHRQADRQTDRQTYIHTSTLEVLYVNMLSTEPRQTYMPVIWRYVCFPRIHTYIHTYSNFNVCMFARNIHALNCSVGMFPRNIYTYPELRGTYVSQEHTYPSFLYF